MLQRRKSNKTILIFLFQWREEDLYPRIFYEVLESNRLQNLLISRISAGAPNSQDEKWWMDHQKSWNGDKFSLNWVL